MSDITAGPLAEGLADPAHDSHASDSAHPRHDLEASPADNVATTASHDRAPAAATNDRSASDDHSLLHHRFDGPRQGARVLP